MAKENRKWIVFRCEIDNGGRGSWIVARERDDFFIGVAESPDKFTALVVKEALEARDGRSEKKEGAHGKGS